MLANLLSWFNFPVGDSAFYSVFGLVFVFFGIALLVAIFTVLGIVMKKINARPKKEKQEKKAKAKKNEKTQDKPVVPSIEETQGLSPEIVAVISAAIAAYYESENAKCDFVVRRIKKL